jgi:two-component system, NtrC family, sensor kinase
MTPKHFRMLRLKIVAMTLCFSLIPLFMLGGTIHYQFSESHNRHIIEGLRTMVQNRAGSIELFFDERIAQLITVARTNSFDRLKEEERLNKIFSIMQSRSKSFIDIGLIDDQGNHVAYVGPFYKELKGVNYAHEDWFLAVMSSGVYVSDVFLGFRKVPHFIIAVTGTDGGKTWILRATINSEIIDDIVKAGQGGKKGDAFIINARNVLQTAPRFSGDLLGHPKTPDFSFTIGTLVEQLDYEGEEKLFAATPIKNMKWVLVITADPREQMAPLFTARYLAALMLAAGILLVAAGTILTTRSMINELVRVERDKATSDDLLMQSTKMAALGKMAAGVAHEINNPLQIIGDQAGWMKDLLEEEDIAASPHFQEYQDAIRKIERHVERCRTITHRLLRFGRRMEPTQEMVDINQVLTETISFLENEAHYRDIRIQTAYDSDLPKITTDQAQLQQVFLNILDNALDAIGKSGSIFVTTSYHSGSQREVVIEISDTGPGIPKEVLGKIFDPFFTTKKANEGTGLGLSISYSILEKLGGHIAVSSRQGMGSTFTIRLPAV